MNYFKLKKRDKKLNRKYFFTVSIIIILLLVLSGFLANACWGKGWVVKGVFFCDETPIGEAKVCINSPDLGDSFCCYWTDLTGHTIPIPLAPGCYTMNVDWDDDGVWDTIDEPFCIVSGETTYLDNCYPLPEQQVFVSTYKR